MAEWSAGSKCRRIVTRFTTDAGVVVRQESCVVRTAADHQQVQRGDDEDRGQRAEREREEALVEARPELQAVELDQRKQVDVEEAQVLR